MTSYRSIFSHANGPLFTHGIFEIDKNSLLLVLHSTLVSISIFILDLLTPLGVAGGVPYIGVVCLSLITKKSEHAVALGVTSSILTVIGYQLSTPHSEHWIVLTNRFYAIFSIWLLVYILHILFTNVDKLKEITKTDYLTRLKNRLYLYEAGEQTLRLCYRNKLHISLIMFDIDDFKEINDQYGHKTGDYVLQQLSGICLKNSRKSDIIARIGGEEFVILMPATNLDSAKEHAEKLRERLSNYQIKVLGGNAFVKVTASFGISTSDSALKDIPTLLNEADKALYQAKQAGKNTCCKFSSM